MRDLEWEPQTTMHQAEQFSLYDNFLLIEKLQSNAYLPQKRLA